MLFRLRCLSPVLFAAFSAPACSAQSPDSGLRTGDVIFQTLPCGSLCDAILATTPCASGRRFNHCGVIVEQRKLLYVVEAIGSNVRRTRLDSFSRRDTASTLAVGRPHYRSAGEAIDAASRAVSYIGTPYDDPFLPGDSALYCSELVWESCRSNGQKLFSTAPMTFREREKTHSGWVKYYQSLGVPPPEGVPGINPCALAVSPALDFFYVPKPASRR